MPNDDESTQEIDVDALRRAAASRGASEPAEAEVAPAEPPEGEPYPSDEMTVVGRSPLSPTTTSITATFSPARKAPASSPGGVLSSLQPSTESVTGAIRSPFQPSTASVTSPGTPRPSDPLPSFAHDDDEPGDPQSVTRLDVPPAEPPEQAPPPRPTQVDDAPPATAADEDRAPTDEATALGRFAIEDVEEAAPSPPEAPARAPQFDDVTHVSFHNPFAGRDGMTAHGEIAPELPHAADTEGDTRMGRLDDAQVRAAFAQAEASEQTAIFRGPVPSMARPSAEQPAPITGESDVIEVDSAELQSVDDLGDAGDTGEHVPFVPESAAEPPREALPPELEALPRFSLASMDDEEVVEDEATRMLRPSGPQPGQSSGSVDITSFDDGGETQFLRRESLPDPPRPPTDALTKISAPPRRPTAPPPAFQPPAPVQGRNLTPAYAEDPDDDEKQLQDERSFAALLDLYRLRLVDAEGPAAKAALFHKIASVYEHALGAPHDAFGPLVEAFDLRPTDDAVVASLERVAIALGRVGELAERARRNLHTADHETRVALLGHIVFWYERLLGRAAELSPFIAELEKLDKAHPVALRRAAQLALANGDAKTQRDLLQRALDRTSRRAEKVHLHLALANAHAGTPEAARHYEAALANDPSCVVALQGLERIGREQEKHAQVEWSLERQVEVALTDAERVDALLKLAELHETKYLKRERAAEMLERVLELEPTSPAALRALERCYHALRDWPRLARVLRVRAENTYDKKQKVELLELAAEVFESKLGDLAAAVEIHRDLLVADPKHRRALGDLARLYEKLGDWGNVATYKARLAELAPGKRQASQLLVQLGDFLAAPDRDPIAARLQYERAVAVDPTHAAAWEALQRVVAAAGDDRRVVACLEQRAKHVDGPRQRAAILVELAEAQQRLGDERAAREAFEGAVRSDPSNEAAAAAMLEVYAREERWAEAAPLCELLVNAAVRDRDPDLLFSRLRLSTRISSAQGNVDRALTSALAALDARPEDAGARADLVEACGQPTANAELLARARAWLAQMAEGPDGLPPRGLARLAQLQREAGELDAAAHTLEQAHRADPEDPDITKALAELYLAAHDYPRACKLMVDMARNATSAEARFALLVEAGEVWARQANELEQAGLVFEEARRIKPLDHWLLHTLMWVYGELGEWTKLSSVLESIAQIQESPERKVKSLYAMAQVVRDKVKDPLRAAALFDDILDIDRKRLDVFEELVRTLNDAKDWDALERSYRKMLARIKDDDDPKLKFALFHQLGLIYRDRLGDAARAYEALEAAGRIRPDDTAVRKILTELLVVTDNVDNAVARTRELVARDPHDPELFAELYELFLRQHQFDKAWCAVDVLSCLREPTAEQRRFLQDYSPMPLAEVPGQIVEQAWRSHILHADLDPTLTHLFALMTPAVARMRHAQLRPDQLVFAVGRPFTPAHSRLHDAIRTTFKNAAEILSMPPPDLLLGDPSSLVPFAPALAPFGAILVSPPAVEARADSLVYVIGKRLAEQRPELAARAFFPSVSDLTALLAAAVRVSRQEGAKDAAGAALDASLSAVMTPQEREGIRSIVMHATMQGGLVDVKRWSQAADLSSMRAGLLLCGTVEPARRCIAAEPQSTADLPPREKIGELFKFAISDLYSDLRGAIGVAVQG